MQTTMDLLNKAMATGEMNASQWCENLKMSRSALAVAKTRGRLSPTIAGNLARMVGEDATKWIAIAALEADPDTYGKEALIKVIDWRKRSNPPRLRLHQARQKRTREAPKFGAFSFVSPKRRMAGLVRAVNRALYRTLTQPHRLGNPRHRHAIGVHA